MTMYINAAGMKYRSYYDYIQSVIALEEKTDIFSRYPEERIEKEIEEMMARGVVNPVAFEEED